MSIQTIFAQLVKAGLSPVGAVAVMGNMQAESAMRSNNAQDGMTHLTDAEYTAAADAGRVDFDGDAVGYGLCQWTYGPRKRNLLNFAKSRGVSVGDEVMQVDFCVHELRSEYPALWFYLCDATGVYEAAARVCKEYERPAVNNIDVRAGHANQFYMVLGGMDVGSVDIPVGDEIFHTPAVEVYWPPRTLEYGMFGPDVVALQGLLVAHGYNIAVDGAFGNKTNNALIAFQADVFGYGDGIATPETWGALTKRG